MITTIANYRKDLRQRISKGRLNVTVHFMETTPLSSVAGNLTHLLYIDQKAVTVAVVTN